MQEILTRGIFALQNVNPEVATEIAALDHQGAECFASFGVALVGGRGAEGEGETDYETENGQEEGGDVDWVVLVGC